MFEKHNWSIGKKSSIFGKGVAKITCMNVHDNSSVFLAVAEETSGEILQQIPTTEHTAHYTKGKHSGEEQLIQTHSI